eukprot:gene16598-22838_t
MTSLKLVAETVKQSKAAPEGISGAKDLLEHHGLSRLYQFALSQPVVNYFSKLTTAVDRKLYKGARWQLADVADWPPNEYQCTEFSKEDIARAIPLAPGAFELPEEDKGDRLIIEWDTKAGDTAGAAPGGVPSGTKLKIKSRPKSVKPEAGGAGAKRQRESSQEAADLKVNGE